LDVVAGDVGLSRSDARRWWWLAMWPSRVQTREVLVAGDRVWMQEAGLEEHFIEGLPLEKLEEWDGGRV
jgi:hypothetical protein